MIGKPSPRSLLINGRRTTIRLEEVYWDELERIAQELSVSVPRLVASIDATEPDNLASAIRVAVLNNVCALLASRDQALGKGLAASGPRIPPKRTRKTEPQALSKLLTIAETVASQLGQAEVAAYCGFALRALIQQNTVAAGAGRRVGLPIPAIQADL
jgi:predicted DNA-binding ribbon-helix-helix protein